MFRTGGYSSKKKMAPLDVRIFPLPSVVTELTFSGSSHGDDNDWLFTIECGQDDPKFLYSLLSFNNDDDLLCAWCSLRTAPRDCSSKVRHHTLSRCVGTPSSRPESIGADRGVWII